MVEFQINDAYLDKIKEFEGCRLQAYQDSKGVWTIGIGHTQGVKRGQTITMSQAESFLRQDLKNACNAVNRLGVSKNQNQFIALVDFVYNAGYSNLVSSTLLKKIKLNRPSDEIQAEFRRWVYVTKIVTKADGTKVKEKQKLGGLVKRREWEAQMWVKTD